MSEPKSIRDIMLAIAANPTDEYGKLLRKCPFIQKELMRQGIISFDDLTDAECDRLIEYDQAESKTTGQEPDGPFYDNLIDSQDVMMRLHISQRTLQTLRSNGTIPFIKIGHKIWYHKADLERILKDNYTMFKIEERYGKDN
ncbi:MAG: helix-turn-helix domain-containing protein [Candidatus Cryptobacteroides sp.]